MYNRGNGKNESGLLKGRHFPSVRLANVNLPKAESKKGKIFFLPERDG